MRAKMMLKTIREGDSRFQPEAYQDRETELWGLECSQSDQEVTQFRWGGAVIVSLWPQTT